MPFQLAQQRQQQHQRPQGGAGAALNLGGGMPQMDQIRQLMEQNPAHIQQMIQQLVANNPALARLLSENPEEFLRQLGGDGADETEGDPGAPVVHVTPEEHEAIQRVCVCVSLLLTVLAQPPSNSWKRSDSQDTKSSRLILCATETRRGQPIICLNMGTRINFTFTLCVETTTASRVNEVLEPRVVVACVGCPPLCSLPIS